MVTQVSADLAEATCRNCRDRLNLDDTSADLGRLEALFVLALTVALRPGTINFVRAGFSGSTVSFSNAEFSSGEINFNVASEELPLLPSWPAKHPGLPHRDPV
jgi:hypothetical protein